MLTQSGKDASFLSGGEFPYPVVQGTGSGLPTVSIQFKEYGVPAGFHSDGDVGRHHSSEGAAEVSSLDYTNAVTLDGFTVPALSTRRVEAEMDLRDGQSFAIAGLINNQSYGPVVENSGAWRHTSLWKAFSEPESTTKEQERAAHNRHATNRAPFVSAQSCLRGRHSHSVPCTAAATQPSTAGSEVAVRQRTS